MPVRFIADIACLAQGIVVIPIHYNLDAGSIASVLAFVSFFLSLLTMDRFLIMLT